MAKIVKKSIFATEGKSNLDLSPVTDAAFVAELQERRKKTKVIPVEGDTLQEGCLPDDSEGVVLAERKSSVFQIEPDTNIDWTDAKHEKAVIFFRKRMGSFKWSQSNLGQAAIILSKGLKKDSDKSFIYTPEEIMSFLLQCVDKDTGNIPHQHIEKPEIKQLKQKKKMVEYLPVPESILKVVSEEGVRCELAGKEFEECKEVSCSYISVVCQHGNSGPLTENSIFMAVCPVPDTDMQTTCPKAQKKETPASFEGKYKDMFEALLQVGVSEDKARAKVVSQIERDFSS